MDPHTQAKQPGVSPRSVKGTVPTQGGPKPLGTTSGTLPQERRKSPRLRCTGTMEFRCEGTSNSLTGTLTDISLHGCYVEMSTTFPVGTKIRMMLRSGGISIQAPGLVRASYPFLGMGISFSELEPAQQANLNQLLNSLA